METNHWEKVSKRYFHGDSAKLCYIEKNPDLAGTPLWPQDPSFNPEKIALHVKEVSEILENLGGSFFAQHIALDSSRDLSHNGHWLDEPKRLASSFVSGFLIPRKKISESRVGFHPHNGKIPSLQETIKNLKGDWLLTNLGYFLTQKLIAAHNERHPADEHLSEKDLGYLGGFFLNKNGRAVCSPPPFGTAGVGITKNGQPILIDAVKLNGGAIYFGDKKFIWKADDVNPEKIDEKNIAIITPAYGLKGLSDADRKVFENYRRTLGKGRINIAIFNNGTGEHPQPKIVYIKDGEMLHPASCLVVSLKKSLYKKGFAQSAVRFECDPWFDKKIWENLSCFYEGLMPLGQNGEPDLKGWQHPNAQLTQETFIPNLLRREPRSILVETKNFFGSFAFSGRYEYSLGVSLSEIAPILKRVLAKMKFEEPLEKVVILDGGSAVKLCFIHNGEAMPLNWIAPGSRNRMGDPNGNTYSTLLLKLNR